MRTSVRRNVSGLGVMFAAALLVLLIPGESGAPPPPPPFDDPIDARIVSPLNGGQVAVINTAARAPFQRSFPQFVIPMNKNVEKSCVAVPSFKRLTIEHVSGSAFFLPANSAIVWFQLETKADGFTIGHILVPVATAVGTTLPQFVTSQNVRLYADGGTDVCFRAFGTDQSGAITVDAQVSGYLVDLTSP